jgi:hypothetical protein
MARKRPEKKSASGNDIVLAISHGYDVAMKKARISELRDRLTRLVREGQPVMIYNRDRDGTVDKKAEINTPNRGMVMFPSVPPRG